MQTMTFIFGGNGGVGMKSETRIELPDHELVYRGDD